MKLCVCKHCRKTFYNKTQSYTCRDCAELDDALFRQIRAYLKFYPNSNAIQLAEAVGSNVYTVTKYIDEGRLEKSRGSFERVND